MKMSVKVIRGTKWMLSGFDKFTDLEGRYNGNSCLCKWVMMYSVKYHIRSYSSKLPLMLTLKCSKLNLMLTLKCNGGTLLFLVCITISIH